MSTGLPFMSYRDGFMNPPKKVAVTVILGAKAFLPPLA